MTDTLEAAAQALERGEPWRDVLEAWLRESAPEAADEAMMGLNEGRGSFALTLAGDGGRALLVGEALSGTAVALEQLGWRVTTLAPAGARERGEARLAGGRARGLGLDLERPEVLQGEARALPFQDGCFDLVVQERAPEGGWSAALPELRRVTAQGGELVLIGDNPLAYKRALGRRGHFVHATPWGLLARALRTPPGTRSLAGFRRLLQAAGFGPTRAYSLYPHAREFSHVVGLDGQGPELTVGRRERQNLVKVLGYRLGLFARLTPSFCVHGTRGSGPASTARIERVLTALAERTGLRPGRLEHLVATRSTSALALTRGGDSLSLHLPLSPSKRRLMAVHHEYLGRVRERYPEVPVPEPVFCGELEGVWVQAERRLGGCTSTHLTGTRQAEQRLPPVLAERLAQLVVRPAQPLTRDDYDRLMVERCEEVRRRCGVASTACAIQALVDRGRERLVGRPMPLMLYHADTRAKHVQCTPEGQVLGLLDWGASELEFLPLADLGHFLVHQRKQSKGGTVGAACDRLRQPDARSQGEQAALNRYGHLLGLDDETQDALIELIPLFVAGMAERNWDYSRPAWVHRQLGL